MIAAVVRCAASARLISDAQERTLLGGERWALATHLALCAKCRRYRRQVRQMARLLAGCDHGRLPPRDADAAVCARIRAGLQQRLGDASGAWRR